MRGLLANWARVLAGERAHRRRSWLGEQEAVGGMTGA